MDVPQWYNRKLWNTSSYAIDGKALRSQTAQHSDRRNGYLSQPPCGNWTNYLQIDKLTLSNKDRGFTNRPSNPVIHNSPNSFSSDYLNYFSMSNSYANKNNLLISSQLLRSQHQRIIIRDRRINNQNGKQCRVPYTSKIIQVQYGENGQISRYPAPKNNNPPEVIINKISKPEISLLPEEKSIKSETIVSDSVSIKDFVMVPQNTPRLTNDYYTSKNNITPVVIINKMSKPEIPSPPEEKGIKSEAIVSNSVSIKDSVMVPQKPPRLSNDYSTTKNNIPPVVIINKTSKPEIPSPPKENGIKSETIVSDSVSIKDSVMVPQNTPRLTTDSSQDNYPKKSILKKTADIVYQQSILHRSNTRILSASFKPFISSQTLHDFHQSRKKIQSAPGIKREVRFDMNNNVIEFSNNY